MSVHWDEIGNRWVIRFRDANNRNRTVTVNAKNLRKYEEYVPDRITERVAKRLEKAVLSHETAPDGSIRSSKRRKALFLEIVARYLPPLLDETGKDKWENRPPEPLENEKTYSWNQLDRMQRILTSYFPSFLNRGYIKWQRRGKRKHYKVEPTDTCSKIIDSITREDVAGFQIYLTNSELSSASIRGYVVVLKTFFKWCHERNYVLTNPANDISLPVSKKKVIEWINQDKVSQLLKKSKGHSLEGPIRTILGLGLRRSEMINLEWDDLSFETGNVRVRGTKTSGSFRSVPMSSSLAKFFQTLPRSNEFPNVLLNGHNRPWNKHNLNTTLRRFRAAGHVPFHWNYQMLRATYGSLLVLQGIPISHVSLVLGHSDIKITQGWYIGLSSADVTPMIAKAINRTLR